MMKNFKRLFTFLLLGVLFFSMALVGCGETLAETKEKGVEAIDTYMQEIRDMDLEYSLVLIEREAEQGKQAIEKAEDKTQATALKEETLNAMKALVLTDEEALAIKRLYLNGKEPTITTIKAYFGQYGGNDVVIMRYDLSRIDDAPMRIGGYEFYFWVGFVMVYTKDTKYHLKDAYESGLISDEDLAKIYEDNGYICEREDFFD